MHQDINISLLYGNSSFSVGVFGGVVWIVKSRWLNEVAPDLDRRVGYNGFFFRLSNASELRIIFRRILCRKGKRGKESISVTNNLWLCGVHSTPIFKSDHQVNTGSALCEPARNIFAIAIAAMLCGVLVWAVKPLLQRYALARPNARSSHNIPTPQGAGIAVVAATILVASGIMLLSNIALPTVLFVSTILIASVGAIDDVKPIPVLPRLLMQAACAAAVLYASGDGRIWDAAPFWVERLLLFFAFLWFINLVNFMDGLDLITVAEIVPVTTGFVLLGWLGALSSEVSLVGAALCGAMLGFAPFNRPVAKVFLGDVGSLPIGLLLAWGLIQLAFQGGLVAALLLPLYYLADATATLLRRLANGEQVWAAHRSHYYQRATDNGFSVLNVVGSVFVLNFCLATLAVVSTGTSSTSISLILLAAGGAAVVILLRRFSRRSS